MAGDAKRMPEPWTPLDQGAAEMEERETLKTGPDDPGPRPVALCLSGGGIRSATFALGVLQGLARWSRHHGAGSALEAFDYVSTVSGGGYIGSWLSRWIGEQPEGITGVAKCLADDDNATANERIRHLRAYSNYLAPRRGVSTDGLTLVGIVGRNLLLNGLVSWPAIVLTLVVPRAMAAALLGASGWAGQATAPAAATGALAAFVGFAIVVAVVAFTAKRLPPTPGGESTMPTFSRALPLAAFALVVAWALLAPWSGEVAPKPEPGALGLAAVWGRLIAWLAIAPVWWRLIACLAIGAAAHFLGALFGRVRLVKAAPTPPVTPAPDIATTPTKLVAGAVVASGAMAGFFLWIGTCLFAEPAKCIGCYVVFAGPYLLATYWLGTVLYAGMVGIVAAGERGEPSREWWARAGATSLRPLLVWVVLSTLAIYGPLGLLWLGGRAATAVVGLGGIGGFVSALVGLFGRGGVDEPSEPRPGWRAWLQANVLPIAAVAFLVTLAVVVSLGTSVIVAPGSGSTIFNPPADGWARSQAVEKGIRDALTEHLQKIDATYAYSRGFNPVPPDPAAMDTVVQASGAETQELARQLLHQAVAAAMPPPWIDRVELQRRHMVTTLDPPTAESVLLLLVFTLATGAVMALGWALTGVNRFSLHAMYGNRLIRAYLGGARRKRNPNRFTDFDPDDDEPMATFARRPLHIVNCALNISTPSDTEQLAWQSRQATSFTVSPLLVGSSSTGYQRTSRYAGGRGITLGRAMTISGAAVSPSMGYHSSPAVSAVMTLFNARLGWWLPNPARTDPSLLKRPEPKQGVLLMLAEAFGLTDNTSDWIHVSDGGHFDNLGLYEMVRRRCRLVVCVDASQDAGSHFDDLVRAIRLIRADFNAEIEFLQGRPVHGTRPPRHYALARIRYAAPPVGPAEEGLLVYLKPTLGSDTPPDLQHYAAEQARVGRVFPHESTADQFFDEAQFEGYRVLGKLSVATLMREHPEFDDLRIDCPSQEAEPEATSVEGPALTNGARPVPRPTPDGTGSGAARLAHLGALFAPTAASAVLATTLAVTIAGTVRLIVPADPISVAVPKDAAIRVTGLDGASVGVRTLDQESVTLMMKKLVKAAAKHPLRVSVGGETLPIRADKPVPVDPAMVAVQCSGPTGTGPVEVALSKELRNALGAQTKQLEGVQEAVERIGPRRNVRGGIR